MAHCINRNHEDFIKLEKETGIHPDILAAKIAVFQEKQNNLDVFPTKEQLSQYEFSKVGSKVQSEVEKISEEIKNDVDKSKIVETVDEYFTIISNHLRNLRERKSYERLKKIFTTPEGINKLSTLQDILAQAQKLQDDITSDARQIRAIAQSIVQIDHLTDLVLEDVKQLVKSDSDSIENLHTLQSYLNTLNDWDILLDEANKSFAIGNPITTKKIGEVKLKINQIESFIAKNDESGVVKTLQEILIPASEDRIKILKEEKSNAEQKLQRQIERKADKSDLDKTKSLIKALEDKIKAIDFENKQNVIDFLKGKRGDATFFNSMLESFRDSSDPTVAAFATFVKHEIDKVSNKVYKIDLEYQKELAPLVTESERLNPASLTEKITFKDLIFQDGEVTEVLTLLNPWKNYRADYFQLTDKEQEAKKTYLESKSEEDKKTYLQARKLRQQFEQEYLYQEFLPEVYEKYKLFDDEIGQELKLEMDIIFERITDLDAPYLLRSEEITEADQEEKDAFYEGVGHGYLKGLEKKEQTNAEPVAWIKKGSLEWHIPNPQYSKPIEFCYGEFPLYTTPQTKQLSDEDRVLEQKLIDFSVRIRELEELVTIERNKNQQAFANGCRHTMKKYGIKNESK